MTISRREFMRASAIGALFGPRALAKSLRRQENIDKITQELLTEGFKNNTSQQQSVFNQIVDGRLKGYTPDNCNHRYIPDVEYDDGQFMLCTRCGHYYLT